MTADNNQALETAKELMDDFAARTGLSGTEGDAYRRYLWTDSFAVQAFFALSHAYVEPGYRQISLKLIENVHHVLGRHRADDGRKGWISGLPEDEGKKHPTIGGLRIGKELPERKAEEHFNEQMEWERDGQYFHYLTRWMNALLQASVQTGEELYAIQAAELSQAGSKFLDASGDHMYWKMSIDLSRPLVQSMGAHDPLEGLICAIGAREAVREMSPKLNIIISKMKHLCASRYWYTTDPLGIGGLLLNTTRVAKLAASGVELPNEIKPEKLWPDCIDGLKGFAKRFNTSSSATQRLAFRECGLSLGVRVLYGLKDEMAGANLPLDQLQEFIPLADRIEVFWSESTNQRYSTWKEHLDINEVSLASSLTSSAYPQAFG